MAKILGWSFLGVGCIWVLLSLAGAFTDDPSSTQRPNPNAVQSLGANWTLAKQASRHEEVTYEIKALGNCNDFEGILRVLSARVAELEVEIECIRASSSYSVKMLKPLEQELAWARESYLGLATIPWPPTPIIIPTAFVKKTTRCAKFMLKPPKTELK